MAVSSCPSASVVSPRRWAGQAWGQPQDNAGSKHTTKEAADYGATVRPGAVIQTRGDQQHVPHSHQLIESVGQILTCAIAES